MTVNEIVISDYPQTISNQKDRNRSLIPTPGGSDNHKKQVFAESAVNCCSNLNDVSRVLAVPFK